MSRCGELYDGLAGHGEQRVPLNPEALEAHLARAGFDDPRSARLIKDLLGQLRSRGVAVFLSTHILEIAERMCDRVVIINKGAIVAAGTLAELRSQGQSGSLEDIFLSLTGGAEYAALLDEVRS